MTRATTSYEEPPFLRARLGDEPRAVGAAAPLQALASSRDGRYVAGSLGRIAWVARGGDGVVLRWFETGSHTVNTLCFSPDGARLYTVGDIQVACWSVADGRRVFAARVAPSLARGALSPDGTHLLVDALTGRYRVDAATGEVRAWGPAVPSDQHPVHLDPVFTADGRFALLRDRGLVRAHIADESLTLLPDHGAVIAACAVGDGDGVVIAERSGRLLRYSLATLALEASGLAGATVHALLADGATLWVYEETRELGRWQLTPYDPVTLRPFDDRRPVTLPAYTAVALRGDTLWTVYGGRLSTHAFGPEVPAPVGHRGECSALRFSEDGARLAAGFGLMVPMRSAMRWSLADGARAACVDAPAGALALSSGGRRAVLSHHTDQRPPALADLDEGTVQELTAQPPHGVSYAPADDGRVVVVEPRSLRVLPDGPTHPLPAKHKLGYQPLWDREADLVVSHDYKLVTGFDLRAGQCLTPISLPRFCCIALAPGGGVWAVGHRSAQRWDLRAHAKLRALKFTPPEHEFPISAAASRDGRLLAIGCSFGTLMLIELDGAGRAISFPGIRAGLLRACAFSDDGKILATGGAEPCVRLWDVAAALAAAPAPAPARRRKT